MSTVINEKDTNLFGSGTVWFFTCVVVTALPTFCSCIFRFLSENEQLTVSIFLNNYLFEHLKDILLIAFSISCSLLTLSIDKSKIIRKRLKKVGIVLSIIAGGLSSFYYFYVDGKNDVGKNDAGMLCFYLILTIICSIIGWIIGNQHDKLLKQSDSSKGNGN